MTKKTEGLNFRKTNSGLYPSSVVLAGNGRSHRKVLCPGSKINTVHITFGFHLHIAAHINHMLTEEGVRDKQKTK